MVVAGGDAMVLTATSLYDPAALRASGIRYLGLSAALPPSLVSPAVAAGLDVATWVVDRRVDAKPWLAAGAIGLFSDDPLYLAGRSPVLTSDPFGQRTYYHGHLASSIAGDRGTFSAPHAWGYAECSPSYKGALQGWGSPIGGARRSVRPHVHRMHRWAAGSDGWAGAFISAADDRSFDDADQYQPGLGGYHILLRQSGSLELHIVESGHRNARLVRRDAAARAGRNRDPAYRRYPDPGHRHPSWRRPDRSRLSGRRGASGRVLPSGPPGRRRPLL